MVDVKNYKLKVSVLKPFCDIHAYIYLNNIDENLSLKEVEEMAKLEFRKQFEEYKSEKLSIAFCSL